MTRPGLGIHVAVLVLVALGCRGLTIKTIGSPTGRSARLGDTIITLMTRLEPYVPTLHRDPGKDRYTVGLLIHSARDSSTRHFVPIVTGQRATELPLMNITAAEGNLVWYRAAEVGAYDIVRRKLLANEPGWSATANAPAKPFSLAELNTGDQAVLSMLIAGGHLTSSQWLGVLSETEATNAWRPGTSIWPTMPVERSREPRRFYRTATTVDQVSARPRVKRLEQLAGDSMLNAAFVRTERMGEILHLAGNGFLLVYESKPNRAGTIMAARVDGEGHVVWTVDTGIGLLREILPDPAFPALIGEGPRIPDKVPEPILVVLDATSGRVATHSLWLK